MIANFNEMSAQIKLSTHTVEKHLNYKNLDSSVFFNWTIMHESIKMCLQMPDKVKQKGKRFELVKVFDFNIGTLGYSNRLSNTVKVVYYRTKNTIYIITAYPSQNKNYFHNY